MSVFKGSPLGELARIRNARSRRVSSWDRTGGNDDRLHIQPGEVVTLADIAGAGCINHTWYTMDCTQEHYLRRLVLRMRWDGKPDPSRETTSSWKPKGLFQHGLLVPVGATQAVSQAAAR